MKKKENSIIRLIEFGPLIFIPLFVAIVIIFIVKEHEENFDRTLKKVEHNLVKSEKESIQSKVDGISNLITYQNKIIIEKLTLRVKQRVITAHKVATSLYEQYKNKKSTKEIQEIIKTTIRPLLWNSGESFIFILDFDGVFQLAPKYLKHLENKSVLNLQDKSGRFIIKEEIELVKNREQGFLWDSFTKPNDNTKKEYKQVIFVKKFGHFNWYFGSGEYLGTALKKTDKELLNSIEEISLDSRNYLFVSDLTGNILLNESTPQLAGKNYNKLKDNKMKYVYSLIHKSIESKGNSFIEYTWRNPKKQL